MSQGKPGPDREDAPGEEIPQSEAERLAGIVTQLTALDADRVAALQRYDELDKTRLATIARLNEALQRHQGLDTLRLETIARLQEQIAALQAVPKASDVAASFKALDVERVEKVNALQAVIERMTALDATRVAAIKALDGERVEKVNALQAAIDRMTKLDVTRVATINDQAAKIERLVALDAGRVETIERLQKQLTVVTESDQLHVQADRQHVVRIDELVAEIAELRAMDAARVRTINAQHGTIEELQERAAQHEATAKALLTHMRALATDAAAGEPHGPSPDLPLPVVAGGLEHHSAQLENMLKLDAERVAKIEGLQQLDAKRVAQIEELQRLDVARVSNIEELVSLNTERVEKIQEMAKTIDALSVLARGKELEKLPPVVVVNSLPKSGSQTIVNSLEKLGGRFLVHHSHAVSDRGCINLFWAAVWSIEDSRSSQFWARATWDRLEMTKQSLVARQDMLSSEALDGSKPFLVSGVREPISFFLSYIFQWQVQRDDEGSLEGPISIDRLVQKLRELFFDTDDTYSYLPQPETWVRREVVDFLKVDPFTQGFDRQRGYQVYDTVRGRLLLFRVEDLSRVFDPAMKELLGPLADGLKRIDLNTSDDKAYKADYDWVRANFRVPAELLDRVYDTAYARTFYTDEEIAGFKAKWVAA